MEYTGSGKQVIINDPVYGFITINSDLLFSLIEHPYFQRLRRIKQLALTHLVYPGALHTRFQHSLGAMHLMGEAIDSLRSKDTSISLAEAEAAQVAILLHDVGHGPFSHALEHSIVRDIGHEEISLLFMERMNKSFNGDLSLAINIFQRKYKKNYLTQLVSGQLDMDRLDYLKRDSFFCGVAEGIVNDDRIINMLSVANDNLVIDVKGIYSIEKFIIARRLMYWQVYLHKTVIAAESLLIRILKRAKELSRDGVTLFATPSFEIFLKKEITRQHFMDNPEILDLFSKIDDFDVMSSVKVWASHEDPILSELSKWFVDRHLYRIEMQNDPFDPGYVDYLRTETKKIYRLSPDEVDYFVFQDTTSNYAYDPFNANINVLLKTGEILDVAEASDQLNISALSTPVIKHFVGYPKKIKKVDN
jgi:HD superfamily phosphohydrolase